MNQVKIQAQDKSGNWRTYHVTMNNDQVILREMQSLQSKLPNHRIRGVDEMGRITDLL